MTMKQNVLFSQQNILLFFINPTRHYSLSMKTISEGKIFSSGILFLLKGKQQRHLYSMKLSKPPDSCFRNVLSWVIMKSHSCLLVTESLQWLKNCGLEAVRYGSHEEKGKGVLYCSFHKTRELEKNSEWHASLGSRLQTQEKKDAESV
jgi:hypothetical protein